MVCGLLQTQLRVCPRLASHCDKAQLRTGSDTEAVRLRFRPESPQWPKLLGTAAASSLATLFVSTQFLSGGEKGTPSHHEADYKVGDEVFVRTMGHLLGPPLVEGNTITPLENGDQIFPAMLSGIRSAQRLPRSRLKISYFKKAKSLTPSPKRWRNALVPV